MNELDGLLTFDQVIYNPKAEMVFIDFAETKGMLLNTEG